MKQTEYLARLTRAARWWLPRGEAEDVAADFQELFEQARKPEEAVCQELGNPRGAVQPLAGPEYRRWLAVFAVLAACILLPAISPLPGMYGLWRLVVELNHVLSVLFLLGLGLSQVWFFRSDRGRPRTALPRGLLPLMAAVLLAACALGLLLWYFATQFFPRYSEAELAAMQAWRIGHGIGTAFEWSCPLFAAAGLFGLVQARLSDRRWRALYVLGFTAMVLCVIVLSTLWSMDLSADVSVNWWMFYIWKGTILGGIGLAVTGVSLC